MFYTVYRTTNNVDSKIYIGKHQTDNLEDDYLGSGKLLRRAIEKHGAENFSREILFVFDNEDEMNAKEAELVTEEFCSLDTNYNICPGGKGGWGYVHSNGIQGKGFANHSYETHVKWALNAVAKRDSKASSKKAAETMKKNGFDFGTFRGRTHTEETKAKMRKSKGVGKDNSQYGTMWINNGREARKIQRDQSIPEGWQKGRKLQVVC